MKLLISHQLHLLNPVKKEVEAKGLKMSEEEFHCRGAFKLVHRGRPNEEDLKNAQEFAKRIVN